MVFFIEQFYLFALFVFGLCVGFALLCFLLLRSLNKQKVKVTDERRDERIMSMYQSLEDMFEELEEYVSKSKSELNRGMAPIKFELKALTAKQKEISERVVELTEGLEAVIEKVKAADFEPYVNNAVAGNIYDLGAPKDEVVLSYAKPGQSTADTPASDGVIRREIAPPKRDEAIPEPMFSFDEDEVVVELNAAPIGITPMNKPAVLPKQSKAAENSSKPPTKQRRGTQGTGREAILALLSQGRSPEDVAKELNISNAEVRLLNKLKQNPRNY